MRFPRAGRVSLAAVGSLALALAAAACSGSSAGTSSATTSAHLEKTNLVVAALPVVDAAGVYLAIKNGYFRQVGLTVTVKPVAKSTEAIPGMASGAVDMVDASYTSFFQAEISPQNFQFKVVADGNSCTADSDEVLALPSSGIKSPAQLAGKTIAVNLANNIQTLMINTELAANGVNPATVHYKVVPFPLMAAQVKAHRVDAIGVVEPFITSAELGVGAVPILSECTGPTADFPISGYFATKAWTQKYPNTARAFQEAMAKGQALADSSRAAVQQILPTYIKGLSGQQAAIVNLGQYPTTIDAVHLQRMISLMYTGGLIRKQVSVQPMLFRQLDAKQPDARVARTLADPTDHRRVTCRRSSYFQVKWSRRRPILAPDCGRQERGQG
jgi:NitT/TauT family transport system substrate-binding protein